MICSTNMGFVSSSEDFLNAEIIDASSLKGKSVPANGDMDGH